MDRFVVDEEPGFWRIIKLKPFRKTKGVSFDIFPMEALPRIDGIDRVIHEGGAISPGTVGEVARPWYIHHHQEDNLLVLQGQRTAEIFSLDSMKIETFVVMPDRILRNGEVVYEGAAMVVWPCHVFHRIESGPSGSASLNFAVRHPGFDIRTAFDVYSLDTATGRHEVIRQGSLDQYPS